MHWVFRAQSPVNGYDIPSNFPVFSLFIREFRRDEFETDCIHHHFSSVEPRSRFPNGMKARDSGDFANGLLNGRLVAVTFLGRFTKKSLGGLFGVPIFERFYFSRWCVSGLTASNRD